MCICISLNIYLYIFCYKYSYRYILLKLIHTLKILILNLMLQSFFFILFFFIHYLIIRNFKNNYRVAQLINVIGLNNFEDCRRRASLLRMRNHPWSPCYFYRVTESSLCRTFDAPHHARIPFDKGCRSSRPIIQTSRRGREDRSKGISKAGVARFPFPLRVFRSYASQRGRSSSFRRSREQYSTELVVTKNGEMIEFLKTEIICFKFVRSRWKINWVSEMKFFFKFRG